MMTALVLLGLAAAAGAVVFFLSAHLPEQGRAPAETEQAADRASGPAREEITERIEPVASGRALTPAVAGGVAHVETTHAAGDGFAYSPSMGSGLTWKTRVFGFVGLVFVISVSAAAIAGGIWMLARVINEMIVNFFR